MKSATTFVVRITEDFKEETETVTVKLERYGQRGWLWTADNPATVNGSIPSSTNENGNGLWNGNQQIKGTSQFSLPNNRQKTMSKIIKSHISARAAPGCGQRR